MPGSTSAGGQLTPLDRDNSSLKLALPVVSPCAGTAKPPVLAWQPRLGVDETDGGAVWSDCACAFVTAATTVTPKEDELDEQEYLEAAARRSPANREQILNDRSLRQHERPSNRLGGTETVSRSARPSRTWLTYCTATSKRFATRHRGAACGRSWGLGSATTTPCGQPIRVMLAGPSRGRAGAGRTRLQTPCAWLECARARTQSYGKRGLASRSWRPGMGPNPAIPHATARCRQIRDSPRGGHATDRRGPGWRSRQPHGTATIDRESWPRSAVGGVGVHWTGAVLLWGEQAQPITDGP
jgi:hypothetical protein